MKQIAAAITAVMILIACGSGNKKEATPATDSAVQNNLGVVHIINKAIETGDFSKIHNLLADDAVDHSGPTGEVRGADSIVASMQQWAKMVTGMKFTTVKEMADKEYVFQWLNASGTMVVDGFGMKAGQSFQSQAIEVTKFNDKGKATDHWEFMTMADMMKMMGAEKPAAQ